MLCNNVSVADLLRVERNLLDSFGLYLHEAACGLLTCVVRLFFTLLLVILICFADQLFEFCLLELLSRNKLFLSLLSFSLSLLSLHSLCFKALLGKLSVVAGHYALRHRLRASKGISYCAATSTDVVHHVPSSLARRLGLLGCRLNCI